MSRVLNGGCRSRQIWYTLAFLEFLVSRKNVLLALASGVLLAGGAGLLLFRPAHPAPATLGSGYVDPAICAGCHEDIAKTYRLTGMGRSFYRPSTENTIEDYRS